MVFASTESDVQAGRVVYHQVAARTRRDELITSHLSLVRHVIGRLLAHLPSGVDVENLEAAGTLGLVEAASKFDPERGIKFETYAYTRIRGAVLDELRRNCPLPQHMLERVAKVRRAYEELQPRASIDGLARAAGLTSDEVTDCLAAMRMTRMLSLNGSTEALEERIPDRHQQPECEAELAEQKGLLAQAIAHLPERERLVVTLYYLEDLRLKEIGQLLDLSESRVSRLLTAAVFELGEFIRAREA
jgi:RNA polymerase sigma factor for flagellar operon FliA